MRKDSGALGVRARTTRNISGVVLEAYVEYNFAHEA